MFLKKRDKVESITGKDEVTSWRVEGQQFAAIKALKKEYVASMKELEAEVNEAREGIHKKFWGGIYEVMGDAPGLKEKDNHTLIGKYEDSGLFIIEKSDGSDGMPEGLKRLLLKITE